MYKLTLQNENGKQLVFNQLGGPFTITEITGLSPAKATINTSQAGLLDGEKFNSSKVNMRSINLAFAIEKEAEANRIQAYSVIQTKKPIMMYYQSSLLDVFIEGYVESFEIAHFAQKQIGTVSILCPFPYFKAAQQVINELSATKDAFHFPFGSIGGKNLLKNTAASTTMNGITFTVNDDGSVLVNGTATASAYIAINASLALFMKVGQSYILNGCPEGGAQDTYRLQLWYNGVGSGGYDTGEGVTVVPTSDITTANIAIYINSGVTVDNLLFKPMVRLASVSDDAYEPFNAKNILFGYIDPTANATVINNGAIECGLTFELYASASISNPKIYNYQTGDYMELNVDMQVGDLITITTGRGNKTITLLREGETTNIFNSLTKDSTWLMLETNGSVFVYEVGTGSIANLFVTILHYDLYEGV